jgi:hypothetical protein
MSFQEPAWLLALVLVPALIALYIYVQGRRSKYSVRFTNLNLLANVVSQQPHWRRHVPAALVVDQHERREVRQIDVVVVDETERPPASGSWTPPSGS